ncbi:MAG: phosphoglycerate dehydrogenase [Chloroflexi bacterium]|nr:phosphoglycerate dehydrogenase [Chloroflexota bacterium]
MPKVLITDPIASDGVELLRRHAEVDLRLGLKGQELLEAIGDYEALVVRSETKVTAEVIRAGKKLHVVGRAGVGVDNIDVEAATQQGIVVVNAPTGNTISAAELALGLMFALARNIPQAHLSLKQGQWRRSELVGAELRGKTLGIIGLGRVGSAVARRALELEMKILTYDPFVSEEMARHLGIEVASFEEVLRRSDFITVHVPLTDATRSLLGAKEIALCKPGVRLINTARGGVIDEQALYDAVEAGHVAGAAVDVFTQEPVKDSPLLKSDRIIVTPHLGASTEEAQTNVAVDVAQEVMAVLQGQPARYAVNVPLVSPETMGVIAPFLPVASLIGNVVTQLCEGQLGEVRVFYEGELAEHDVTPLKAAVIGGMLQSISEERVTLVNASLIAQHRGLRIIEQMGPAHENYSNLITVEATTSAGRTVVSGTLLRGHPHIVQVNGYWLDLEAEAAPYLLLCENLDRPGRIGAVGTLLGNADINIAFMQVGRDKPRGMALMVLGLDEPIGEEQRQAILDIGDVYSVKLVRV